MKLEQASFAYGTRAVLRNLTLSLPDCGITGLQAPSGSGKTTLLRLIAGLEKLDSGVWHGPSPRETAMLFQENRLVSGLSAEEQVRLVLPRGADARPYLKLVGLEEEAGTCPAALSGGMQRRLALARLLAYGREKKLLLLDEPFTGVDPRRAACIMAHIRARNIPVVLAAHDGETLALCHQVLHLSGPPLALVQEENCNG